MCFEILIETLLIYIYIYIQVFLKPTGEREEVEEEVLLNLIN